MEDDIWILDVSGISGRADACGVLMMPDRSGTDSIFISWSSSVSVSLLTCFSLASAGVSFLRDREIEAVVTGVVATGSRFSRFARAERDILTGEDEDACFAGAGGVTGVAGVATTGIEARIGAGDADGVMIDCAGSGFFTGGGVFAPSDGEPA